MRTLTFLPLALTLACNGGDDAPEGITCNETASLCGTVDAPGVATPVTCTFAATEYSDVFDPPTPDGVWDAGVNAFERREVEAFPFDWALNGLEFWDGEQMWVSMVCDSDGDGTYTAADVQGVYGGDVAEPVVVPSTGIDLSL